MELLDHLHRGGNFAHWWHDKGKESRWFNIYKRPVWPKHWTGNIYYSVHPCTQIPDGDKRYVRSRLAIIAAINCLFGEYDAGADGKYGIAAHLDTLPLQPSVIIDSGGGYHAYWLLDEPTMITDANRDHIKQLQYIWVDLVGSDQAAKDLARVLRPVGTINVKPKYAPDFPEVQFVKCDLDCLYTLSQFEALTAHLRQEKPRIANGHSRTYNGDGGTPYGLRALSDECNRVMTATNGTRNDTLNKAAFALATLVAGGELSESFVRTELLNSAVASDLSEGEADRTIESAFVAGLQKPRNAPERSTVVDHSTGELDTPTTVQDVLKAIAEIAVKEQIVSDLHHAIGDIDRSQHQLIITELCKYDFSKTDAKEFVKACFADAKERRKAMRRAEAQAKRNDNAIQVNDRQLSEVIADTLETMADANVKNPSVFVRGGALVRVTKDENEWCVIQEISAGALLGILADIADWETVSSNEDGVETAKPADPPRNVISAVLERGEWPFPGLVGIVNAPVFSRSGKLQSKPGYDIDTRLYMASNVELGDITPTQERIEWSKNLILHDLLVDFPFSDDASLSHSVSFLLLPFVRDMINGPTPPHVFDAPTAGTGKGMLADACAYPFLGNKLASNPAPKDDDEWRKQITTTLIGGASHFLIDNVNHEIDSGSLATAFTQPVWNARMLATNENATIPIRVIWAITANNIKMSQELARRSLWIRIDANEEMPWLRKDFKHNLDEWLPQNRDNLVTAALVLINAWLAQGKPLFTERKKGSYESWAKVMGGILQTVGINGFLENEEKLFDHVISKGDQLTDFVKAWAVRQANRTEQGAYPALSAHDLFKLASVSDNNDENRSNEYYDLLGDMLGAGNQRSRQTKLGHILSENRDKVIAGHKILLDERRSGGVKWWRLERVLSRDEKMLKALNL